MLKIKKLSFTLDINDENKQIGILHINLTPTCDSKNIESINYTFKSHTFDITGQIDEEIIINIFNLFMYDNTDDFLQEYIDHTPSLIKHIENIIYMNCNRLETLMISYEYIFQDLCHHSDSNYKQSVVDIFCATLAVYLVMNDIHYRNKLVNILPITWTFPYDRYDIRILTYRYMKYISHGYLSNINCTSGTLRSLVSIMLNFMYTYMIYFNLGPKLKNHKIVYEITNQILVYNKKYMEESKHIIIQNISHIVEEKYQYYLQELTKTQNMKIKQVQDENIELRCKMLELENRINLICVQNLPYNSCNND